VNSVDKVGTVPFTSRVVSRPIVRWSMYLRARPLIAYAMAVSAVFLATVARWAFGPETGLPFLTYFPTVTIVGLFAGTGPGLMASLLSATLGIALFAPRYAWGAGDPYVMAFLLFLILCGLKLAVIALLHRALDELVEQERNIHSFVEAVPAGIVVVTERGSISLANAMAQSLFGYGRAELLGNSVDMLLPEKLRSIHRKHRLSFMSQPQARAMGKGLDLSCLRKDGTSFEAEIGLSPLARENHTSVIATVVDTSERRRALERERFVMREVHHRNQNMFAVIQSIIRRTLDEHPEPSEASQLLLSRVDALAEAHKLLLENVWEGAQLRKIIDAVVGALSQKIETRGCELVVKREAVQQVTLIFHELTTNSLKYGALSTPRGRVSIDCCVDREAGVFELSWREEGGPPVVEPTRRGFGSSLLIQAARQFADEVSMDYHPQGLRYELRTELDRLEQKRLPDMQPELDPSIRRLQTRYLEAP
jgi:PAS domain S-box-containing protein